VFLKNGVLDNVKYQQKQDSGQLKAVWDNDATGKAK